MRKRKCWENNLERDRGNREGLGRVWKGGGVWTLFLSVFSLNPAKEFIHGRRSI